MPDTTQEGVTDSTEQQFQGLWDAPEQPAEQQEPAEQAEQTQQSAEQDEQAAQQQETQEAKPADKPEENQEEVDYADLDDYLTKTGIEPESFRSLPVKVKIDGEEKLVPLSDVLKSYQLEGHVNNKSIELSNERRVFDEERQAVRQLAAQQLQRNEALSQAAQQILNQDFQAVDWQTLRATDPAEYSAKLADFQMRQARVNELAQQIAQQRNEASQQDQQNLGARVAEERNRMLEARPQWRDEGTFAKDREQMVKYAKTVGYTDAELNQVLDHRALLVLDAAARYAALQASKPEALKRVRQAPKAAAPGARVNANPKDAQRQQVIERFNRNPRDVDSQAAVFEFLANEGA